MILKHFNYNLKLQKLYKLLKLIYLYMDKF